jgi:hypothetical protein
LQVLRAANNSLSGALPSSAASSARLFLLDLHGNSLAGPLPEDWSGPRLQMVLLQDNALTGGGAAQATGEGYSKHCTHQLLPFFVCCGADAHAGESVSAHGGKNH